MNSIELYTQNDSFYHNKNMVPRCTTTLKHLNVTWIWGGNQEFSNLELELKQTHSECRVPLLSSYFDDDSWETNRTKGILELIHTQAASQSHTLRHSRAGGCASARPASRRSLRSSRPAGRSHPCGPRPGRPPDPGSARRTAAGTAEERAAESGLRTVLTVSLL